MKLFCSNVSRLAIPGSPPILPFALVLLAFSGGIQSRPAEKPELTRFNLAENSLVEVLKAFSRQSSLQLLYAHDLVDGKRSNGIFGEMPVNKALRIILKNTGLKWQFINENMVAIVPAQLAGEPGAASGDDNVNDDVSILADIEVQGKLRWWESDGSDAVFGFNKPLLETPRSVSVVNVDAIELFAVNAVDDLSRIVPGAFTTTRWGIQGAVDIRNIPADTYFRGMKRITLQGHGRSVLAAMDSIEVAGGPASPLMGIGKFGGYVNFIPKSGRSYIGQYLNNASGFGQIVTGEYNRRELSFGVGGPYDLTSIDRRGGYYVYGLVEDSDSFTYGVPVKQKVLQAATSIEDMVSGFRLETGFNVQISRTAGALTGRFTQNLVDDGTYISGSPLVDLDLNGNGLIGYLETHRASPVAGELSSDNQPLHQVFPWPTDAAGDPLPLDQFPQVSGIPQSMYAYLQENPQADPTGLLRAQGVGGPQPVSSYVPLGMVLDPRTTALTQYKPRRSAAFEKDLRADFFTAYFDLVHDEDPDLLIKNQLFFDVMNQYKSSNQPFSQRQDVRAIENKLTVGKRIHKLPEWLDINTRFSISFRNTVSEGEMTQGDYGNHRNDANAPTWNNDTAGMTPNTTFASSNENSSLANDGLPWSHIYRTEYSVAGVGALFDIDLFSKTNLVLGARFDGSMAETVEYAGRFQNAAGTSVNPGYYEAQDDKARGWDSGPSWSASLSHQLPYGLRPYMTVSETSIILDRNNNSMANAVIEAGHLGRAALKEAGVKFSARNGALEFSSALYEQGRIDVAPTDPAAVIQAYATSTTTRGWQTEIKWAPISNFHLSAYIVDQITRYTPNVGGSMQVDARALGFTDIYDNDGNLVYPAEAFLYGGRARIILPDGMNQYEIKQGNPERQIGLSSIFQFTKRWGLTFNGNYLSSTCSGRLCLVEMPGNTIFDMGIYWDQYPMRINFDVKNATDEQYFRARTGDTLGDVIAQSMPGRVYKLTINYRFGESR